MLQPTARLPQAFKRTQSPRGAPAHQEPRFLVWSKPRYVRPRVFVARKLETSLVFQEWHFKEFVSNPKVCPSAPTQSGEKAVPRVSQARGR